jgi:hypothetical protein
MLDVLTAAQLQRSIEIVGEAGNPVPHIYRQRSPSCFCPLAGEQKIQQMTEAMHYITFLRGIRTQIASGEIKARKG